MNYEFMARRLETWLAPEDLLAAGRILKNDRARALEPASLLLGSATLSRGEDGGLRTMTEEFLRRFSIPEHVIQLLQNIISDDDDEHDFQGLRELRFEGTVEVPDETIHVPIATMKVTDSGHKPVGTVKVKDSSVFLDVVTQPLKGLQGIVAVCAKNWHSFAKAGIGKDSIYHRHIASEPFAVWMDAEVGRACGFPHLGRLRPPSTGPNIRYRAITVSNFRQANSKLLAAIRETSRAQALSTWEPIR
jgi:hypothetical protein